MAERRIVGRYTLRRRILKGDVTRGLPEIWRAEDYGDLYYLKLWKRKGEDRADIRALWNREVRGLMRLQGYPGAAELFVRLQDLNADEKQYYAVLDSGGRVLLSEIFAASDRAPWLRNLGEIGRRRPLWEGILRIAEALAVLHGEGTLHRSLSPASIFVGPDGQGDFRLSGFEWSLRVAGSDGAAVKVGQRNAVAAPELDSPEGEYSIATDWFDFGLFAAELFGVAVDRLKKRETIRKALGTHRYLNIAEKDLLLGLLAENHELRLADADGVTLSLRDIVRNLGGVSVGGGRPLVLAVRLGIGTNLSRAIENASRREALATDSVRQKNWIEQDLRGDIRITARTSRYPYFVVHGAQLEYRVKPWSTESGSTWDIGFCDSAETFPRFLADDQRYNLGQRRLEIRPLPEVHRIVQTIRDRSATWDKLYPFSRARRQLDAHLRDVLDFFRITQQLDTLLTVAGICPVEVIAVHRTTNESEIELTPREEPERNELAQYLGLAPPSEQLRDWFNLGAEPVMADDENDPKRDLYQLLNGRKIDSDGGELDWRFVGAKPHPSGPRYYFRRAAGAPVRAGPAYLARNHGGTLTQIKRRQKAIEELRSHEDLLRLIANPRESSRSVGDPLPKAKLDIPIDDAKLIALERLWQARPSFAVQGPPGTGKTTLIKAFADRLFAQDPSVQVLVTAHSHHTVDDVRRKLRDMFATSSSDNSPIMVRLGGRETSEHDIGPITEALLGRLYGSDLAQEAPSYLRDRLDAIAGITTQRNEVADGELRTMQLLVQDAANLTFVTSNAADLAEMATRGRRFDWSIIEEAGKAHGFDMAGALQASHRLLLIGDHRQLPPFNAGLFRKLLANPLQVRKATQVGAQFAPNIVDRALVDDEDDRASFADRCDVWRQMVTMFGLVFDRSLAAEPEPLGPAATLSHQHRMHPDIAELVGRIFYPDSSGGTILESPPETYEEFSKEPPFVIRAGSWLSDDRIVWYDVPWVQKKEWAEGESDGLFEAPTEARGVVEILDQLRPRAGMPCEIQILSPYNDQLKAIRQAIDQARRAGRLAPMFAPPFDLRERKRLGATVDEFQGSEADIVIVSLVRNNGVVPWKSLGFLKEANRMNVLLSRARHKLVLVGSWEFFASRCDGRTLPDVEYYYIGRMMDEMDRAQKSGRLARVTSQP